MNVRLVVLVLSFFCGDLNSQWERMYETGKVPLGFPPRGNIIYLNHMKGNVFFKGKEKLIPDNGIEYINRTLIPSLDSSLCAKFKRIYNNDSIVEMDCLSNIKQELLLRLSKILFDNKAEYSPLKKRLRRKGPHVSKLYLMSKSKVNKRAKEVIELIKVSLEKSEAVTSAKGYFVFPLIFIDFFPPGHPANFLAVPSSFGVLGCVAVIVYNLETKEVECSLHNVAFS